METCTITGDSDIVGPGVRLSVYLQSITILIGILAKSDEILDSVKLGALTSFSLILSAVVSDLNYVLLLEVSQFVSLLMATTAIAFTFIQIKKMVKIIVESTDVNKVQYNNNKIPMEMIQRNIKVIKESMEIKFKKLYNTYLLYLIVNLTISSYNIWLFTVLKWRLPKEECGNQVKFYFFIAQVNPIGGYRIFMLVMNYISLISLSLMLLSQFPRLAKMAMDPILKSFITFIRKDKSRSVESRLEESKLEESKLEESKLEELKIEESKSEESKLEESKLKESKLEESKLEESKSEELKSKESKPEPVKLNKIIATFIIIVSLASMTIIIASIELSVQKSPISDVWKWGFGQVLAIVLAVIDVLSKFIKVSRVILRIK
jgi:hypothetical protein